VRNFVSEGLFGFTMARIQLILLALLATSISVKAGNIDTHNGEEQNPDGEIQTYSYIYIQ
jgi:hypothetical protein